MIFWGEFKKGTQINTIFWIVFWNVIIIFIGVVCTSDTIKCATQGCIHKDRWCDGHYDCYDLSDEIACHRTPPSLGKIL